MLTMTYVINREKSSTKISNKAIHLTMVSITLHIVSYLFSLKTHTTTIYTNYLKAEKFSTTKSMLS